MLRKLIVLAVVAMLPAVAHAAFKSGDWDLAGSASAAHGPDFNGLTANADVSLGYLLSDQLELGVRQGIGYTDIAVPGSAWTGSTDVFVDLNFNLGDRGEFVPFVGGNIGYVYGDGINDTWAYGPEAGLKYFLNSTTYVGLMVQYQVFCDTGDFSDGQFVYTVALGVAL